MADGTRSTSCVLRQALVWFLFLIPLLLPRLASAQVGWTELPNTTLQAVCPSFPGTYGPSAGCSGILSGWNGGIADTRRNRLIVWGGGHNSYYGNEVYALDVVARTFTRLDNPSPPNPDPSMVPCPSQLADGAFVTPNSRETYGGLVYVANRDEMFVYGGSPACNAGGLNFDSWTLNLANVSPSGWTRRDTTAQGTYPCDVPGPLSGCNIGFPGVIMDYDPMTGKVFYEDMERGLFRYTPATNTWEWLSGLLPPLGVDPITGLPVINYNRMGVIDPVRKLFFGLGDAVDGQAFRIDISGADPNYTPVPINATNCGLMNSEVAPGLAYDSVTGTIVGWAGGNTVYIYNPATDSCTQRVFSTYPPATTPSPPPAWCTNLAQQCNGTWGRFRYFPGPNVFALVNEWDQNAWLLKLR